MEKYAELNRYIASLGLTYNAEFVPQYNSRNAGNKSPSINWIITLSKGNIKLVTDYMQGIGHIPKESWYNKNPILRNRLIMQNEINNITQKGKYSLGENHYTLKPLPVPLLIDVLYSLIMDSDALNYGGFEDWASNFGYDEDSIKAEKIYKSCIKIALKLRSLISNVGIETLNELYQDY